MSEAVRHRSLPGALSGPCPPRQVFAMPASKSSRRRCAGEEGSAAQGSTDALTDAPTWLVDPLDGTTNFVHRQPNVCVSIALAVRQEVPHLCLAPYDSMP